MDEIAKLFSQEEFQKYTEWDDKHYPKCKFYDDGTKVDSPQGAIGGRLTFSFTPTSVGLIIRVECACGEKIDCTDYSCW